jgi:hypothetical protein
MLSKFYSSSARYNSFIIELDHFIVKNSSSIANLKILS